MVPRGRQHARGSTAAALGVFAAAVFAVASDADAATRTVAVLRGQTMDDAGQPIAGARLALRKGRRYRDEAIVVVGESGSDGRFSLSVEVEGTTPAARLLERHPWGLQVDADGYARTGVDVSWGRSRPGSVSRDQHLGSVVLVEASVLRGRVDLPPGFEGFAALDRSAFVIEVAVGNVAIEPLRAPLEVDGTFELGSIAPGDQDVWLIWRGVPVQSRRVEVLPLDDPSAASRVEFELPPVKRVEGSIADLNDQPVAHATVRMAPSPWPASQQLDGNGTGVDPDGSFSLLVPQVRELWLVADAPGLGRKKVKVFHDHELTLERSNDLRLKLPPASTLKVDVGSESGEPIAEALVSLGGKEVPGFPRRVATDAGGEVVIRELLPAEYFVMVQHPFYERAQGHRTALEAGDNSVSFRLAAVQRVDASLRFVDGEDRPVVGANVVIELAGFFPWKEFETDDQGEVPVKGLPVGRHRVQLDHDGYRLSDGSLVVSTTTREVEFRVSATEPVSQHDVSGRVLDPGGQGVAGAVVQFEPVGSYATVELRSTARGSDGRFLAEGLTEGQWHVWATAPGWAPARLVFRVEAAAPPLVLRLEKGTMVSGPLVGMPEATQARARVTAMGPPSVTGVIEDGGYRIGPLSARDWRISVSVASLTVGEARVSVVDGQEHITLPIETKALRQVSGQMLVDGEPLDDGHLMMGRRSSSLDALGRFFLTDVPADEEWLRYDGRLGRFQERITAAGDVELNLEETTRMVRGRVVEASNGAAISGAWVGLGAPGFVVYDSWTYGASTDDDGSFEIGPVLRRPWNLGVSKDGFERHQQPLAADHEGEIEIRLELAEAQADPRAELRIDVQTKSGPIPRKAALVLSSSSEQWTKQKDLSLDAQGRGVWANAPVGSFNYSLSAAFNRVRGRLTIPGPELTVKLRDVGGVSIEPPYLEGRDRTKLRWLLKPLTNPGVATWEASPRVPFTLETLWAVNVTPGEWRWEVFLPDGREWSGEITVVAGQRTKVIVRGEGRQ